MLLQKLNAIAEFGSPTSALRADLKAVNAVCHSRAGFAPTKLVDQMQRVEAHAGFWR
jgi:hypothetical protein